MAGNFAEFGAEESGARIAELDHQKDVASTIQGLMHIAQTQEAEARLPLIRAEARKTGAEADTLEQKAVVQRKVAAMMAGRQPAADSDNIAFDMAGIYAAAGDVDTATKLQLRGTQIETGKATQRWRNSEADTQELMQLRRAADLGGSLAQAALVDGTQEGYDRMRAQAQAMRLDVSDLPPDFASAKPVLAQHAAQGMSVKQWADSEIAKQRLELEQANKASLQRVRNSQIAALDSRRKLTDLRYNAAARNGGFNSSEARDYAKERTKLAESRRQLVDLQTIGRTADNPRPVPLKSGSIDIAELNKNVGGYYTNSKGQVGRWNGEKFDPVAPSRKMQAAPSAPDTSDDADVLGETDNGLE